MKFLKFGVLIFAAVSFLSGCYNNKQNQGLGAVGWDSPSDIEEAKHYPSVKSDKVAVTSSEVPFGTFRQEFDNVFQDFPFNSIPVMDTKTIIANTRYSISYEKFVLKLYLDDNVVAERTLPKVFYMHKVVSGAILGNTGEEDIILCRTFSRGTTGLHYICIFNGKGDVLYESVFSAKDDWDIVLGENREIIIGGAKTKTVINILSKK